MKLILQKLGVASLTLTIGLFSTFIIKKIYNSVIAADIDESDLKNVVMVSIAPKSPRFIETGRGCGNGYIQGYETNDGMKLFEGTLNCKKPKNNDSKIFQKDSKRIISKIETLEKIYYNIYQLENSHCINSPTIELGLELEDWLASQK